MKENNQFEELEYQDYECIEGGGLIGSIAGGLAGFMIGNVVGSLAAAITYAETGDSNKAMNAYGATVVAGTSFGATAGGIGTLVF